MQIFAGLKSIGQNPFVYAQVTVMLVVTLGLYSTSQLLFGNTTANLATSKA